MFGFKLVRKIDLKKIKVFMDEHNDFIFNNMVMIDHNGRSESPNYDKARVSDLWFQYHDRVEMISRLIKGV